MTRIDLQDPNFLALTAAEQELLSAEYEDYAVANSSGVACCRTIALIVGWASLLDEVLFFIHRFINIVPELVQLMLLLLVRHILYAIKEVGMAQDISVLFNVSYDMDLYSLSYSMC